MDMDIAPNRQFMCLRVRMRDRKF